jgi:hypothetical protein
MDDKFYTFVGTIIILGLVGWLLSRIFHQGRLSGIRKAVTDLSRQCSFHYESKDDELPEKVVKALDYMKGALQRGKGAKGRSELYLVGAGMLGDAMGEAAWQKGFEAGRQWTDPRQARRASTSLGRKSSIWLTWLTLASST